MSKWILRVCGITAFGGPVNNKVARHRNFEIIVSPEAGSMDVSIEKIHASSHVPTDVVPFQLRHRSSHFHSQNSAPPPLHFFTLFPYSSWWLAVAAGGTIWSTQGCLQPGVTQLVNIHRISIQVWALTSLKASSAPAKIALPLPDMHISFLGSIAVAIVNIPDREEN